MDLSKINYINSAKYLPPELQKNEYYLKQCSLIDSLLSSNSEYFKYERNQLQRNLQAKKLTGVIFLSATEKQQKAS